MAAVANAFDLLTGAEQQLASKKKKKNKATTNTSKPEANGNGVHPVSAQPAAAPAFVEAPAALPAANLVVGVSEACAIFERAAREARSLADKVKLWKDWTRLVSQPFGAHAIPGRRRRQWPWTNNAGLITAIRPQEQSLCVGMTMSIPHMACSAHSMLATQAGDKSAKSLKYTDVDGSHLDFKQVGSGQGEDAYQPLHGVMPLLPTACCLGRPAHDERVGRRDGK
jgi:hypothetical protein